MDESLEGKITLLVEGLHSDYVRGVYHLEEVRNALGELEEELPAESIASASIALTSLRMRTQELLAVLYLLMQKAPPEQ